MKLPVLKQLSKTTWFVIVAALSILVVWGVVIIPAVGRLKNTAQAIVNTQTTQASSAEATANLISALQRRTELTELAKRLENFFISRTNPLTFVSRLEELAADHRVSLDVSLQEPTDIAAGPVAQSAVTIDAAGQMTDVLGFMNDLLTEPVFLDVQSMSITTPSDTPGVVTMTLETISYWQ